MNDSMNIELSAPQRELLLRGLRFVRSSRMLEFRDTCGATDEDRQAELKMVSELQALLGLRSGQTARV